MRKKGSRQHTPPVPAAPAVPRFRRFVAPAGVPSHRARAGQSGRLQSAHPKNSQHGTQENIMTTPATTSRPAWQPTLPVAARLGLAAVVVAVLVPVWRTAEGASRDAVQGATHAMARSPVRITLPSVQVIGKRGPATPARRDAV
jgi:hypothetical protein